MAWDDPVVWILIVAFLVLLFGSNKIPEVARAIGKARRELELGMRGIPPGVTQNIAGTPSQENQNLVPPDSKDPLVIAAQREGIEIAGKSRDQIATELAWKLNKK